MPELEDPKKVSNNDLRNAQFGGGFINAENVNAGRIGGDIWNFFLGQQAAPVGDLARPKNQRILLASVKEEFTARLRQSLHNAVLINLGKEPQPQQVKRPWDADIKIGQKAPEPLPDTTTILEVFDSEEIAGKLLILGNPGSGKTTTQLELAQALVIRAEKQPEYPVPVLFNLSSWKDDRQSLTDWLVAELKSKYRVSVKLGKEWVENQQLLPLLDGLDELEPQRQELCVRAINQFLASENRPLYLVVCSRIEEYSNYANQLQLDGAIYLQPLTSNQICDYLNSINSIELWSTISNNVDLLELVKSPLLLSITVLASQEISVEEWQHFNSTANPLQYLLDAYTGRMLTRDINSRAYFHNKTPNARKTRMWLVWLAKQMQRESKTEFLIEEMQPILLKNNVQKLIYELIGGLIVGLIYGLLYTVIGVFSSGIIYGLKIGIIGMLVFSNIYIFFNLLTKKIEPFELNKWSWKKAFTTFKFGLKWSFLLFITFEVIVIICYKLQFINLDWRTVNDNGTLVILNEWYYLFLAQIFLLFIPLCIGVVYSLFTVFILGFLVDHSVRETKNIPNQGVWESAVNAINIGLLFCLICWLIWLISTHDSITALMDGLVPIYGLIGAQICGGRTCIQHFSLRLVLYRNGYIPWNYARFLDYCTERLFLQRVGGRYRFIHKMLQEHFAQMPLDRIVD